MGKWKQPYHFFWGSILIIWVLTWWSPKDAIDIQFHDTYIVFAFYHLAILFSLILGGMGVMYWWFRKKSLRKWMSIFHTICTIFLMLWLFFYLAKATYSGGDGIYEVDEYRAYIWQVRFYFFGALLFLLSQIIFVLNLLIAVLKKE